MDVAAMKMPLQFASAQLVAIFLILFTHLSFFAGKAMAQKETSSLAAFLCIKEKWPDVRIDPDSKMVFVPGTGQNLAWDKDKQAWIDVKTLRPVWGNCKNLSQALWTNCIKKKWPEARIDPGSKMVFIPETGQNLAWDKDKQAWIDVKTGECICPKCEPKRTAQAPTPSTTDKVTNVLRTIGGSVSIGIGGGGGGGHDHHGRVRGEDRTRTGDKVHTDSKTHTIGKTSSSTHKTVTAACKCHPCTCSPCRCH
jgi:hypothetical protein